MTTMELIERGIGHNCLSDAYDLGRADAMNDDGVPKQLLEMGYKKGRADAIDDLVKKVCEFGTALEYEECYAISPATMKQTIADFGEQLKEQDIK